MKMLISTLNLAAVIVWVTTTFAILTNKGLAFSTTKAYIPTTRPTQPYSTLVRKSSLSPTSSRTASTGDTNTKYSPKSSENNSYLRWRKTKNDSQDDDDDEWQMQTAIQSFQRGNDRIELHAQLHYGDKEYFEYWNSKDDFNDRFDHVLYELLVDDELLRPMSSEAETLTSNHGGRNDNDSDDRKFRVVTSPIDASSKDQSFAEQYGWSSQASVIDYTHPKWIHADLSRQEFTSLVELEHQEKQQQQEQQKNQYRDSIDEQSESVITDSSDKQGTKGRRRRRQQQQQPLWQLASSVDPQSSSAATEAVSALLVGPPSLLFSSTAASSSTFESVRNRRRLFTNLFLPGSDLALILRSWLWVTIPSPELSIILLDFSSILEPGTRFNPNTISKIAIPILKALVRLDFTQMRRFVFGQMIMSTNRASVSSVASQSKEKDSWSLLVTKRNDHALQVVRQLVDRVDNADSYIDNQSPTRSTAILYGTSHCPDLHKKLIDMGFQPTEKTWRTVWSVNEGGDDRTTLLPSVAIMLSLYLGVGALDWINFLGDVSESLVQSDFLKGFADAGLYLIRHVFLYVGLSKFLIEWTNDADSR